MQFSRGTEIKLLSTGHQMSRLRRDECICVRGEAFGVGDGEHQENNAHLTISSARTALWELPGLRMVWRHQ